MLLDSHLLVVPVQALPADRRREAGVAVRDQYADNTRLARLVKLKTLILAACLLTGLPACTGMQRQAEPGLGLEDFFDAFTDEWMAGDPDGAVSRAYFSGEQQDLLEQQLTPWTADYRRQRIALAVEGLERLAAYDLSQVEPVQRHAADVMRWQLQQRVARAPFLDHHSPPLQHYRGAGRNLVTALTISHPFQNARDVENYLLRMEQVDVRMREATADSAARAGRGFLMPSFIIDAAIEQLRDFVNTPPAENPYVATLRDKSAAMEGLEPATRKQWQRRAERLVVERIYPAWREAIVELQRQRLGATDEAGVYRLPRGEAYYASQLRYYTSTDLSADEIHNLGLREVERISTEMLALFDRIGIDHGSLDERRAVLRERLRFPDTDAGRTAMIDQLRAYLDDARRRSASLFDKMPTADVVIQPFPEFLWKTASASYKVPPQDGSRPGIFQMPLRPNRLTDFEARTLVIHETIPGHHFQLALLSENTTLPRWMQIRAYGSVAASSEGWALYAERLAAEEGWYEGDITGQIGQLSAALHRARRLVVDTGLHAKGWSRQEAIDYGISPSEVDRYVVRPGQACAYMIGQMKLLELRDQAQKALGERFSIREFHNLVLAAGIVPLAILEQRVRDYIAAQG